MRPTVLEWPAHSNSSRVTIRPLAHRYALCRWTTGTRSTRSKNCARWPACYAAWMLQHPKASGTTTAPCALSSPPHTPCSSLGDVADIGATTTHSEAEAGAIASVGRARVAVAEAVLAVEEARRGSKGKPSAAAHPLRAASASLASLGRGILSEIRHITADTATLDSLADSHHGGHWPGPRRRLSPHRYEALRPQRPDPLLVLRCGRQRRVHQFAVLRGRASSRRACGRPTGMAHSRGAEPRDGNTHHPRRSPRCRGPDVDRGKPTLSLSSTSWSR